MVIIRVNANLPAPSAKIVTEAIHEQAKTGVIVLPNFCELLNEVPADETVKVVFKQEHDSEKEYESEKDRDAKELFGRLMQKLCSTCAERYAPPSMKSCGACSSGSLYRKA